MPQPTESDLSSVITRLSSALSQPTPPSDAPKLLGQAKLILLHLNALIPSTSASPPLLSSARAALELGALLSIRLRDAPGFIRYFQQLQPFYVLPDSRFGGGGLKGKSERSKITGLYLLLLLSQGDYLTFHMVVESLELLASSEGGGGAAGKMVEDEYVQYPVRIERALMEGSYDRVWGEITGSNLPGQEFSVFSEVSSQHTLYALTTFADGSL
jgi:26S proteasome regulatory subunit N12